MDFQTNSRHFSVRVLAQRQIEYNEYNYERYSLMRMPQRASSLQERQQSSAKKRPEWRKIFFYTLGRIVLLAQCNLHKPSPVAIAAAVHGDDNSWVFWCFVADQLVARVVGGRLHEIIVALASFTAGMQKATVY